MTFSSSGAIDSPSPVTSVVMPWKIFDAARGSTRTLYSDCPSRSMNPGNAGRAIDLLVELVAIPSVTGDETALLDFVAQRCKPPGWTAEWMDVAPGRRNLFLHGGSATVVFMTHADTVPPFSPPRRKGDALYGRGSCDAKASLAAMAMAADELATEGAQVGLLVLVGEERGSDGALAANRRPHAAHFLIGGEPTGSRFVAGSKGCLRIEV